MSSSTTLNHPLLGPLNGLPSADGKTIQFRNLKYASIPGRFQDPVLNTESLSPPTHSTAHCQQQAPGVFDATKHGPSCPQHPRGWAFDLSLIGKGLDNVMRLENEAMDMDEFECLHAVVTVPVIEGRLGGKGKLPVMVLVHGGGFSVGSNSWPQYDLSNFVATSVDIGKPVVGVSVNYRVGPFGLLSSSELGSEGNFALKDLVCAFKWIQANIPSFSGSPTSITAFGESAGSILLANLLHIPFPEPLFQTAILMSGDNTLQRPRSPAFHTQQYKSILTRLSLQHHPVVERVQILRSVPARDLVGALPMFSHWSPASGEWIKDTRLTDIADGETGWCDRVVIGDCLHDGTILANRVQNDSSTPSRLNTAMKKYLSVAQGEELLRRYRLDGMGLKEEYKYGLLILGGELRFYYPILCWERGFASTSTSTSTSNSNPTTEMGGKSASPQKKKDFGRYHFHLPNPFPGNTNGYASHELDLFFLLGNFPFPSHTRQHTTTEQPITTTQPPKNPGPAMRNQFISFANGSPWGKKKYDSQTLNTVRKNIAVFGAAGREEEVKWCDGEEYDSLYRDGRGRMLMGWDVERVFRLGEEVHGVGEEMEREKVRL